MNEKIEKKISDDFVSALRDKGISQAQIARHTGITKGQISKIFNGTKSFSLDMISELGFEYQIPVAGLLTRHMTKGSDKRIDKLVTLIEKAELQSFELVRALDQNKNDKAAS